VSCLSERHTYIYIVTYSGVLFTMEHFCTPKIQYTTVKHSQKLFERTCTSNLYGLGTLTPIEFFHRTSCGNLPTLTPILAVRKFPNTRRDNPSSGYRSTCTPQQHLGVYSIINLPFTSPDDRMSSPSTV
jgi:hypothetical protein